MKEPTGPVMCGVCNQKYVLPSEARRVKVGGRGEPVVACATCWADIEMPSNYREPPGRRS
jgi:hypothetical protein